MSVSFRFADAAWLLGPANSPYPKPMDITLSPVMKVVVTAGPYEGSRGTIQGHNPSGYDVQLLDGTTISVPGEGVRLRPVPPDDADMLITRWREVDCPPIPLPRSRPGCLICSGYTRWRGVRPAWEHAASQWQY